MEYEETIKNLKSLEKSYLRSGYKGDASDYAFKRLTLELLNKIAKKKRNKGKLSKWN
jgi:hypothetical protein